MWPCGLVALWLCRHIDSPEGTTARWSAQGWCAGGCAWLCLAVLAHGRVAGPSCQWAGGGLVGAPVPAGGYLTPPGAVWYTRVRPRALLVRHKSGVGDWIINKVEFIKTSRKFYKNYQKFYKYVQPTVFDCYRTSVRL